MSKIKIAFIGSDKSNSQELITYLNVHNEIYLEISDEENQFNNAFITLDIDTAIQLVKELKKQIGYFKNSNQ